MEWTNTEEHNTFVKETKINSTTYRLKISVEDCERSYKVWVWLSSGRKRKSLNNYLPDSEKRDGGIKALIWAKNEILNFHKFLLKETNARNEPIYICIQWSDGKRREVYKRLIKYGFWMYKDSGFTVLRKRVN